jgi:hypothetical protein
LRLREVGQGNGEKREYTQSFGHDLLLLIYVGVGRKRARLHTSTGHTMVVLD